MTKKVQMKDKNENNKKKDNGRSRRNFLRMGMAIGTGTVAGGGLLHITKGNAQTHSGEKTKVLSTDGKLVEIETDKMMSMCSDGATGKDARKGIPGKDWVMVVDLSKCKNARKCVESCQKAHHLTPEQEWLKVFKMQDSEDSAPYWFPKTCFHCDNAPCVKVCPVEATYKRSDGITLIDSTKCIGCKYCMVACPYSSRYFNWEKPEDADNHAHETYSPETSHPIKAGTVGKCDFCPDLLAKGELPHCATSCPMGVIYFGDKNEDAVTNGEETLKFSELMRDRAGYRYLEHFGTEPSVYYLPPVDRQFPFEDEIKTES